ncbi:hypothetical protein DH09_16185 [Bacillaceae bacterium JMAK1]|nr:hypothetical protein DH09_16185 [Bacillaceae bacterium JMAK1]
MTALKIRNVALQHFANLDYDSVSLQQIAEDVGIRKASLYAHYKNKEDIFFHVLDHAMKQGKRAIVAFFVDHKDQPLQTTVHSFFHWFMKESDQSLELKLMIRVLYFPPKHVSCVYYTKPFLTDLERWFARYIVVKQRDEQLHFSSPVKHISLAFLTVAEGCLIEFFFAENPRYEERVQAILPVFFHGIQKGGSTMNEHNGSI